jgi:hypothetical protein
MQSGVRASIIVGFQPQFGLGVWPSRFNVKPGLNNKKGSVSGPSPIVLHVMQTPERVAKI